MPDAKPLHQLNILVTVRYRVQSKKLLNARRVVQQLAAHVKRSLRNPRAKSWRGVAVPPGLAIDAPLQCTVDATVDTTTYAPLPLIVDYSPQALREHFAFTGDAAADDVADDVADLASRINDLSDAELHAAADEALNISDRIWEDFHQHCCAIVRAALQH